MQIPNKLLKKWVEDLEGYGLINSANEMGINYRTIRRAIDDKKCSQNTFNAINNFLLKKSQDVKRVSKKVIENDLN